MNNAPHDPIPVKGFERGVVRAEFELHLTGGLRARRVEGGWKVGPLPNPDGIGWLAVVPENRLGRCAADIGQEVFGLDERHVDSDVPSRLWRSLLDGSPAGFQAADQWGFVASSAHRSDDAEYAVLAASISTSLRAAGVQFRNVSDCYYDQLLGALLRKAKPGARFANLALTELHIACHGLAAEMGSARDYIATIAARRVGAPPNVDALNRLASWAKKPINAAAASDPLVQTMVAAFDKDGEDPWLWELGEYRNTFLHRLPLGLSERANRLVLCELETPHGPVRSIKMEIEAPIGSGAFDDVLSRFVKLGAKLERLARDAAGMARHPANPPVFVAS